MCRDIADLCRYGDKFTECYGWGPARWVEYIRSVGPKAFKRQVRSALLDPLSTLNFLPVHLLPRPGPDGVCPDVVACLHCSALVPTLQQARLHEFKVHGRLAEARMFVAHETICRVEKLSVSWQVAIENKKITVG